MRLNGRQRGGTVEDAGSSVWPPTSLLFDLAAPDFTANTESDLRATMGTAQAVFVWTDESILLVNPIFISQYFILCKDCLMIW